MLVILNPNTDETTEDFKLTWQYLLGLPDIRLQKHKVQGRGQKLTEIYLIGNTAKVNQEEIEFGVRNKRIGQEFYPFLIMLLALVLALEQTLANRFYRKEPATEQAVESGPALVATEVQA